MRRLMYEPLMALVVMFNAGKSDAPKDEKLTDEQFLIKAMECNHCEVQRAEMAQKRSDNAEVRKFAGKLGAEHEQCRKELLKHAGDIKVAVVSGLDKEHKETMDRLSKLEGKEFDREYLKTVIDAHQKAIKLFEAEARDGAIDALRAHAKKMVPVFQDHRKQAQKIKDRI